MSLEPGKEGTLLWNRTFTPPSSAGNISISMGTVDPEDGVFLFSCSQTRQRWGYSLETGQMLWGPTTSESQINFYGMSTSIYQGKLFSYGYGGELIAYNIKTGEIIWNYTAKNVGFESPYGNYPLSLGCIADGKIYLISTEHSPSQPLWRGACLRCINTTDGKEVWKISCWEDTGASAGLASSSPAIADGYIVALNLYDDLIYCYGKGPSDLTVTAPDSGVELGKSIVIRGTVTDIAAGTKQNGQAARFPNGVPAVSDDSMTAWMEYVYMHQSRPTNVTGVPVTIDVIDSNNNYRNIGTTTTDERGSFSLQWTPNIEGKYTVIARFEGSASYYPASSETSFAVDPHAPTSSPYPVTVLPPTETYVLGVGIAIIIAIAISTLLILRKRP